MTEINLTKTRIENLKNAGILDKRCKEPRVRNWAKKENIQYNEICNNIEFDRRRNAGKYVEEEINRRNREKNNYEEDYNEEILKGKVDNDDDFDEGKDWMQNYAIYI